MHSKSLLRLHCIAVELASLSRDADLTRCDAYLQHGDTSVLLHCVGVAYYSMLLLDLMHIRYDRHALVRGALLHDFFLYDWHVRKRKPGERMHAFSHALAALQNARAHVDLTAREENIILHHMFPVTPVPPTTREGVAVCLTDKFCALYEGLFRNTYAPLRRLCAHHMCAAES